MKNNTNSKKRKTMPQTANTKQCNISFERENVANVLIVDDDPEIMRFMLEILARKGIRGHLVNDKESAMNFLDKGSCDLVISSDRINKRSNNIGYEDGIELVKKIRSDWPEMPIILMADNSSQNMRKQQQITDRAVSAIRHGCCDFLLKPLERKQIENLLDTFLPNHSYSTIVSEQEGSRSLYQIVGKSAKLIRTVDLAGRIAPTSAPVLISGESGTGKELIAYLIHRKSKRSQSSYIRINCAALSDTLLESELFGHEKGAFTGAYTQRKGRFEMAHGGTLLLDEITETPIRFQAKLLRVLEQQDFERVGGNESVRVDVRIISTTNKDMLQEVRKGRFRPDLYYRLSAIRLNLCPLRERADDLSELVWYFINQYCREVPRRITKLDPATMGIFSKYHWPGNVRQLRNVVRTSLILGDGPALSLADVSWLFEELQPLPQQKNINSKFSEHNLIEDTEEHFQDDLQNDRKNSGLGGLPLKHVERKAILATLRRTGGNQTKAAKVLGISDRTLRERIQRYKKQGCMQPV
ncbi:sigma-54-dependent transcriptional regulator [Planctomycetota bacterium]